MIEGILPMGSVDQEQNGQTEYDQRQQCAKMSSQVVLMHPDILAPAVYNFVRIDRSSDPLSTAPFFLRNT